MSFLARCIPTEISERGRYTNLVWCEVKILHSKQNPGTNGAPILSGADVVLCSFFLSFLFLFPTLCCVAPGVGVGDSQSTLWRGPLSRG